LNQAFPAVIIVMERGSIIFTFIEAGVMSGMQAGSDLKAFSIIGPHIAVEISSFFLLLQKTAVLFL